MARRLSSDDPQLYNYGAKKQRSSSSLGGDRTCGIIQEKCDINEEKVIYIRKASERIRPVPSKGPLFPLKEGIKDSAVLPVPDGTTCVKIWKIQLMNMTE